MELPSIGIVAGVACFLGAIFLVRRACRFRGGNVRVVIESRHSIADAVAQLQAVCMPLDSTTQVLQWMTGRVDASGVRVQRRVRREGNSFRPIFTAGFQQHGKVTLVGRFAMDTSTQAFLAFWFSAMGGVFLLCLLDYIAHARTNSLAGMGISLSLLAAGSAILRIGKTASASDIAWLTSVMREALA